MESFKAKKVNIRLMSIRQEQIELEHKIEQARLSNNADFQQVMKNIAKVNEAEG